MKLFKFKMPEWGEAVAASKWNTVIVWVLRVLLGLTFIYSGFAKAIDPWGGMYKLTEYFNVLGFDQLVPASLAFAFILAAIEFMLGLFVLVGAYRRSAPVLLLCMMAVLLPLTLWLAITDAVPDCGCFGDATHMSNWATFFKNLLIVPALFYLVMFNKRVHGIYGPAVNWVVGVIALAYVSVIAYNGYFKQPLIDYRPYPVGAKLGVEPEAQPADDDYVFIYEKDGVQKEFSIDSVPDDDSEWTYVDRRVKGDKQPKGRVLEQPLAIFDNGTDVTDEVLTTQGDALLYLFPDLPGVNIAYTFVINNLTEKAVGQGATVAALTSATEQQMEEWRDISMASYDTYSMDDSDLKMIARGNPAVVMLHDGRIVWKRTLASLDPERLRDDNLPLAQLSDDYNPSAILKRAGWLLLMALLALLVVNRTHVLVGTIWRRLRGKQEEKPSESSESSEN
ncbi:MAG: DoxX family protein [Muribaculaceae bacterium]|nr:DoxX family protein [Muribaculaceae bacterium]